MFPEIHTSRVQIGERTREYIERRIAFALSRFSDAIQYVAVHLEDINGNRGGADKQCRIRVQLDGHSQPVLCSAVHERLNAAVDIASGRVSYSVSRVMSRRKSRDHQSLAFAGLSES